MTDLAIGDLVVGLAPGPFATVARAPRWACCKVEEDEDAEVWILPHQLLDA